MPEVMMINERNPTFSSSLPKKGMFPLAKKRLEHMLSFSSKPVTVVRGWSGAPWNRSKWKAGAWKSKVCDGHSVADCSHSICILSWDKSDFKCNKKKEWEERDPFSKPSMNVLPQIVLLTYILSTFQNREVARTSCRLSHCPYFLLL